jgi:DNA-binding NarL/FixJ family response regulator
LFFKIRTFLLLRIYILADALQLLFDDIEAKERGTMEMIVGLIVARQDLVRDGYQALFSAASDIDVQAPVDDGQLALARIEEGRPYLVILDSSLGIDETKETIGNIRKRNSMTRFVVICRDRGEAIEMRKHGADSALIEGTTAMKFSATVKSIAQDIRTQYLRSEK